MGITGCNRFISKQEKKMMSTNIKKDKEVLAHKYYLTQEQRG